MTDNYRNFTIVAYLAYEKSTGTENVLCKNCGIRCDQPIQGIMFDTPSLSDRADYPTCEICGINLEASNENQV